MFGLRITGIDTNSPLKGKVNLYEDFIREINSSKNMKVAERTQQAVRPGQECVLKVYNMLTDSIREVTCTAHSNEKYSTLESLLGVRYKLEEEECSWTKVMRVIEGKSKLIDR